MRLSAVVLTRNEERNIKDCLTSLSWADELLVIDSGSTDGTVALAEKQGARIVTHLFSDFATQRNFAMSEAKGDWVLFIDADERVTKELADEIARITQNPGAEVGKIVYAIPRQNFFFGKRLRFGDSLDDAPVRFFPRLHVAWAQPVHEIIKTDLPVRKLKHHILHYSTRDRIHFRQKIREYISLELKTMKEKGIRPSVFRVFVRPPARFFQLYLLKLGILDGFTGFQYAILSAYYTFEKHWRYWKNRSLIAG